MGCNNNRVAKKEILGARQQSWLSVTVRRRKMIFQVFGKEIRGLGSGTKKYKDSKHNE